MGDSVDARSFTRQDRTQFRAKSARCLDALASMLADGQFEFSEPKIGIEIELNLVDAQCDPAMANAQVLEAIADRNRVASAVLEAIFVEDQAIHARLDATAITAEGGTTLATHLVPRDRAIDSLAAIVERSSRENSRIARRLEAGLAKLEAPPGPA